MIKETNIILRVDEETEKRIREAAQKKRISVTNFVMDAVKEYTESSRPDRKPSTTQIPTIKKRTIYLRLVGISPLIVERWSQARKEWLRRKDRKPYSEGTIS
jgi:hypothetical protein